ncbi:MAG: sigma-70 family RNA polymerase sigma factor [Nitrososphaerales archaeon]
MAIEKLTPEQIQLVEDNMEFAIRVANKMARQLPLYNMYIDIEDLRQIAIVGLIQAAQKANFDIIGGFKSFAYKRIVGNILDECRKVSKHRGKSSAILSLVSYDEASVDLLSSPSYDHDELIDITMAVPNLNERELDIISSLAKGVTNKELAQRYNLTESRISQIAKEARNKIYNR